MKQTSRRHSSKIFYGWWVVALSFLVSFFSAAFIWYGFTAYFAPLVQEFGWSYTAISVAGSFRSAEVGVLGIFVGFLVDRFGGKRVIVIGSVIVSAGFLLFSRITSLTGFYVAFLLIAVGGSGLTSIVLFQVVTKWFNKRLGLVLGIVGSGFGAGGFAIPGIVFLIDQIGFRNLFAGISAWIIILGALIWFLFVNEPKEIGLNPDGKVIDVAVDTSQDNRAAPVKRADYTLKQAMADWNFWIVNFASTASLVTMMMLTTHIMPCMENLGYSRSLAGIAAAGIPVTSIIGRLSVGWLSDTYGRRRMFILTMIVQTIGMWLFIKAEVPLFAALSVVVFGVSYGGIHTLRVAVLKSYYGIANIGSIMGVNLGLSSVLSIIGPLVAGYYFDNTGTYLYAWIIAGVMLTAGIPLLFMMKKPEGEKH